VRQSIQHHEHRRRPRLPGGLGTECERPGRSSGRPSRRVLVLRPSREALDGRELERVGQLSRQREGLGPHQAHGGGGSGPPTPDGPQTDNQANFGVAFACSPGAHTDQGDCGRIEQFGADVAVGRTHTVAFTIATATPQPETIANVTIEGDQADEYTLDPGTCTPGAQIDRADPGSDTTAPTPAQTCALRVTFTPPSAGLQRATLVIGADGADRAMTISLRGTGTTSATASSSPPPGN
jgi:hypothetical protein